MRNGSDERLKLIFKSAVADVAQYASVEVPSSGTRLRKGLLAFAASVVTIAGFGGYLIITPSSSPLRHSVTDRTRRSAQSPIRIHFSGADYKIRGLAGGELAPRFGEQDVKILHLPLIVSTPQAISFGAGRAWVLSSKGTASDCGSLIGVPEVGGALTVTAPIHSCPVAVSYGAGSVWVLSSKIGVPGVTLERISPQTLQPIASTTLDGNEVPVGDTETKFNFLSVADKTVFATVESPTGGFLVDSVDVATMEVRSSRDIPVDLGAPSALVTDGAFAWLGTSGGWIAKARADGSRLTDERRIGTRVISMSSVSDGLWATINLPQTGPGTPILDTLKLNPRTGAQEIDTGLSMFLIATSKQRTYGISGAARLNGRTGLLALIHPATGRITRQLQLPVRTYEEPDAVGVAGSDAWIINSWFGTLTKVSDS